MDISNTLRSLRLFRRVGQTTFARRIKVTPGYISLLEQGGRQFKTLNTLQGIVTALGLPLTLFVFLTEVDELEKTHPELVKAMLNASPELKAIVLFKRMHQDGFVASLPSSPPPH